MLIVQTSVEIIQVRAAHLLQDSPKRLPFFVLTCAGIFALIGVAATVAQDLFLSYLWPFVFGPQWEVSREMAIILLIPAFVQVVSGPISRILIVTNRPHYKFGFDSIFVIAGFSPVILAFAGYAPTPIGATWAIALMNVAAYCIYLSVVMLAAKFPSDQRLTETLAGVSVGGG